MEVVIQEYNDNYQKDVIDLILDIQQKEFSIPIGLADQPDLTKIPTFYQTGVGNFWIALYHGEVVGTISLLDIGSRCGAIRKLFVKTAFRGSRYRTASLLLEALLAWAKTNELKTIYLGTTEKFLAAHRFYEKNDFIAIDKEKLPEAFPIMKVDTRFYKLEI